MMGPSLSHFVMMRKQAVEKHIVLIASHFGFTEDWDGMSEALMTYIMFVRIFF